MPVTVTTFKEAKQKGEKITMITAYDYSTAKLFDEAGVDSMLIGDSLGMTMLGYKDTLPVTMEDMLHHSKAVVRGTQNALVVSDMPYMSYHLSVQQAVENAGRFIQEAGASAVKIEGGAAFCPEIEAMVRASIPVVGHIGLTPQSINAFGGFKAQGKSLDAAKQLIEDAQALEDAGAFAMVIECVPAKLAEIITAKVGINTIGIGAGAGCDGQVLVYQDMLNMYGNFTPKFVRTFADVGTLMKQGVKDYCTSVKDGSFPAAEHTFKIDDEVIEKLS